MTFVPVLFFAAVASSIMQPSADSPVYRQDFASIDNFVIGAEVCLRGVSKSDTFITQLHDQGWIRIYRILADGRRIERLDNGSTIEFMRNDVMLQFYITDWVGMDRTSCHVSARFSKSTTEIEVDSAVQKQTRHGVERGWWMGEQSGSRPTLGYFNLSDALVASYSFSYVSQKTGDK